MTRFFSVRRKLKIFFAFGAGAGMVTATFGQMYDLTENVLMSVCCAILAGAAAAAFVLLFMEIIRLIIGRLRKQGLKMLEGIKAKRKDRKND